MSHFQPLFYSCKMATDSGPGPGPLSSPSSLVREMATEDGAGTRLDGTVVLGLAANCRQVRQVMHVILT